MSRVALHPGILAAMLLAVACTPSSEQGKRTPPAATAAAHEARPASSNASASEAPAGQAPHPPRTHSTSTNSPPAPGAEAAPRTEAATPPAGLRCLTKYYAGEIRHDAARGFELVLPSGSLSWDDGKRDKDLEALLNSPDLSDIYAFDYPRGPIAEATGDPGRIRVDAVLLAAYGPEQADIRKHLTRVELAGHGVSIHDKAADALRRVDERLTKVLAAHPDYRVYFAKMGGTFNYRKIAGTDRLSAHSFGVAIDLNPAYSSYWRWEKGKLPTRTMPVAIVHAFEAEGFVWGGRWLHFDTMHFEYRPEILDPNCYESR